MNRIPVVYLLSSAVLFIASPTTGQQLPPVEFYPASPPGCEAATGYPSTLKPTCNPASPQVPPNLAEGQVFGPTGDAAVTHYRDPNFNTQIQTHLPWGRWVRYSSQSSLSATGKYILVQGTGGYEIRRTDTGAVVSLPDVPQELFPSVDNGFHLGGCRWHPTDDEVCYYAFTPWVGSGLNNQISEAVGFYRFHVTQGHRKLVSYGPSNPIARNRQTMILNFHDLSRDGWMVFLALYSPGGPTPGDGDTASKLTNDICAVNVMELDRVGAYAPYDYTHCANFRQYYTVSSQPINTGAQKFSAAMSRGVDSESGKRYVLFIQPDAAPSAYRMAMFRFGATTPGAELQGSYFMTYTSGHMDFLQDTDGRQYMVRMISNSSHPTYAHGNYIAAHHLGRESCIETFEGSHCAGGSGGTYLLHAHRTDANGGPWQDTHVGCAKTTSACVVSLNAPGGSSGSRFVPVQQPLPRYPYNREVFVFRGPIQPASPLKVYRIANSQSLNFTDDLPGNGNSDYWDEPHAALSGDGNWTAWESNFGYGTKGWRIALARTLEGAGQSVNLAANQYLSATAPASINALTQFRVEMRLHGLTAAQSSRFWSVGPYEISFLPASNAIQVEYSGPGGGLIRHAWNNRSDVALRVQLFSNGRQSFELWDGNGGNAATNPFAWPTNWNGGGTPATVNLSGATGIGGYRFGGQTVSAAIAFFRLFPTTVAEGSAAPAPVTSKTNELLRYEFDNSSIQSDGSLSLTTSLGGGSGAPAFITTPQ